MDMYRICKQLLEEELSRVPTNRKIRSKMFLKIPWSITSNSLMAVDNWEIHAADGSSQCPAKMKWLLSQRYQPSSSGRRLYSNVGQPAYVHGKERVAPDIRNTFQFKWLQKRADSQNIFPFPKSLSYIKCIPLLV